MDKRTLVRDVTLFEGVTEATLKVLEPCFRLKRFSRGELLWREGQASTNFTFIARGRVKLVRQRSDGQELIIDIYGQGEAVGEAAAYMRVPYPASAVALDEVVALVIHRDHLHGTLQRDAGLLEVLLQGMMDQHLRMLRRLGEVTTASAEQRLALLFVRFADREGVEARGEEGVYVGVPLSRRDLCDLINTRVETAIRLMSRWQKAGWVRTDKKGFTILDLEVLRTLAEGLEGAEGATDP